MKCPNCKEKMTYVVLTSMPPQYVYQCPKCPANVRAEEPTPKPEPAPSPADLAKEVAQAAKRLNVTIGQLCEMLTEQTKPKQT